MRYSDNFAEKAFGSVFKTVRLWMLPLQHLRLTLKPLGYLSLRLSIYRVPGQAVQGAR
jgi:hypothetical protein